MDITNRIIEFQKRWNIKYDDSNDFMQFRNRILFSLDKHLGELLLRNRDICNRFSYLVGSLVMPQSAIGTNAIMKEYVQSFASNIGENPVYLMFSKTSTSIQLIICLQYLFWVLEEGGADAIKYIDNFYTEVKQAIKLSTSINIRMTKRNSNIFFYPAGAKILDDKLVNENLQWLENYPIVLRNFEEALNIYTFHDIAKYRNLLDNLRFAIEELIKIILKNKRSLENQKSFFLSWLKNQNINQQTINMFNDLLFQKYLNYQNEVVKHADKSSPEEIEFMIYLTGTFIRMLIQLNERNE